MAKEGRDEKGRFKIGNLWWMYSDQGCAPEYKDPKKMSKLIGEYLTWEENTSKGKYTISGLALYLGFASRQSLYDYEKKTAAFSYMIKRYKLFLTHYHEQKIGWVGTFPGAKLWLTNYGGYTEESTVNQNVTEYKTEWSKDADK